MKHFARWLHAILSRYVGDDQDRRIFAVYNRKHLALETFTRVRDELMGVVDELGDERIECHHTLAAKRNEIVLVEGTMESLDREIEGIKQTIDRIDGLVG